MYIAPNTTIYILNNVPLTKGYENTVFYSDSDAQLSGFLKYVKYTLNDYSYQRTQLGTIRVSLKYEQLYDCNYLIFKNSSFENKYFYCFITGVSYINNEVSEMYYEMDLLQTWAYDYTFMSSYVERRHAESDVIFENTQPEGLELGNKYIAIRNRPYLFTESDHRYFSIQSTASAESLGIDTTAQTNLYYAFNGLNINNLYNGLYYYSSNNQNTIQNIITAHINKGLQDAVVAFYQAPYSTTLTAESYMIMREDLGMMEAATETETGYTPKNKKLYSYPFNKITVTNGMGMQKDFYWENCKKSGYQTDKPTFNYKVISVGYPQPSAALYPAHYIGGTTEEDEGLTYSSFPSCSFSGDTYKVWWAQNKNNYLASLNAIGTQYDTNMSIAANNYSIAARNAETSAAGTAMQIDTQLGNAMNSANAALTNNRRTYEGNMVSSFASGMSQILSLNPVGGLVTSLVGYNNAGINAANNENTIATNLANSQASAATQQAIAQMGLSTALKNASTNQASAALSALSTRNIAVSQLVSKKQDIQNEPDTAKGNAICEGVQFATNRAGYFVLQMSIKREYLEIIDDYFTRYGYAQNKIISANDLNKRINRPHYTYTKTVGAIITGKMNQNDLIAIQSIYDNGVTTWDTLEDVGNYDLDNQPES